MDKVLVYEMWPLQVNDYDTKMKQIPMMKELGVTHVLLRANGNPDSLCEGNLFRKYHDFREAVQKEGMKMIVGLDINIDLHEDYTPIYELYRTATHFVINGTDGFYLIADKMKSETMITVVNELFSMGLPSHEHRGGVRPFLIIGSSDDPNDDYNFEKFKDTPVNFVDNLRIKDVEGENDPLKTLVHRVSKACTIPKTAISLETYGSKRITSTLGVSPIKVAEALFMNGPDCIILYQGQELDMKDINTSYENTFEFQKRSNNSTLSWYKFYIDRWKNI